MGRGQHFHYYMMMAVQPLRSENSLLEQIVLKDLPRVTNLYGINIWQYPEYLDIFLVQVI